MACAASPIKATLPLTCHGVQRMMTNELCGLRKYCSTMSGTIGKASAKCSLKNACTCSGVRTVSKPGAFSEWVFGMKSVPVKPPS